MNKITTQITAMMQPKAALIAYENSEEKNYFLELRTINKNGKMSEGMPVTYEFMNAIAQNYSEIHSGTPFGIIHPICSMQTLAKGMKNTFGITLHSEE